MFMLMLMFMMMMMMILMVCFYLVAEFIVSIHEKSSDYASFQKSLSEQGAEFPDSFVVILDRLICQMHPDKRKSASANPTSYGSRDMSKQSWQDDEKLFRSASDSDSSSRHGVNASMLADRSRSSESRGASSSLFSTPSSATSAASATPQTFKDRGRSHRNDYFAPVAEDSRRHEKKSVTKRLSSPERFEIKQLIAAGVLSISEYPDVYEDEVGGAAPSDVGLFHEDVESTTVEQEFEIELKTDEPDFLRGQTQMSLDLSPVKIVKNPEGSLNRSAMAGTMLAKERREVRQQQMNAEAHASLHPDSLLTAMDPMAAPSSAAVSAFGHQAFHDLPEWKKASFGKTASFGKITKLSIVEQRQSLPIYKLRASLIQAVRDNQLLIVVGDTGSGKTTQMTQYLAEEGFCARGKIGCTQPRRVAATSVAKRVAEEFGCRLGEQVGYTIRFEDCTSSSTIVKYMTDGMMLRECLLDGNLSAYSVIILDEAHERTIHTDVLFGLLKKTLARRPDLKLIVTSATLDAEKFSSYFFNCPIFTIPGRTFPVEVLYTKEPETDYLDSSLITVMQIHLSEPPGDILLFLTGQEEIDTSCEILYERMKALGPSVPELIILPVYSALPSEVQSRIFEPAPIGSRKVGHVVT